MGLVALPATLATVLSLALRAMIRDRRSLRFLRAYIRSFQVGHTALADERPGITFRAQEWLSGYLEPGMCVFEYGTGGSTLFLARRVRCVVSVEHQREWYEKMRNVLSDRVIRNCELILREPDPLPRESTVHYYPGSFTSADQRNLGLTFESYVKTIDRFPDGSLDLVLVDGRSRASCLIRAVRKIRPSGYLMLDNAERECYADALALLREYPRVDFSGIGPSMRSPWRTSAWQVQPG